MTNGDNALAITNFSNNFVIFSNSLDIGGGGL